MLALSMAESHDDPNIKNLQAQFSAMTVDEEQGRPHWGLALVNPPQFAKFYGKTTIAKYTQKSSDLLIFPTHLFEYHGPFSINFDVVIPVWFTFVIFGVAILLFGLSYAMPDKHHLVIMRLLAWTTTCFGATTISREGRNLRWSCPLVGGWLIMGLAYLPDVTWDVPDYAYYRTLTWMCFVFLECLFLARAVSLRGECSTYLFVCACCCTCRCCKKNVAMSARLME